MQRHVDFIRLLTVNVKKALWVDITAQTIEEGEVGLLSPLTPLPLLFPLVLSLPPSPSVVVQDERQRCKEKAGREGGRGGSVCMCERM